jgi:flavorubredoxin
VNPLPRELAPGLFWLGQCMEQPWQGAILHNYNSVYLVRGEHSSLLVEAGHPQDLPVIEAQLEPLLAAGPPLRYLFATHQETPHSSGIARLLHRHPQLQVCGDVRDYHLFFPGCEDRLCPLEVGASIDLGGTEIVIVEAVIRDLMSTQWAFDTARRTLFPGDGFAYSHYHQAGMCGSTAEEAPELALEDMTELFAELALYWTRFTDMEPYVTRLDALLDELGVALIAPTHGLPITDRRRSVPAVLEGLRSARPDLDA